MALKDHYLMEDMDNILIHIENLLKASTDVLKAAETANPDIAKNAQFQINNSMTAILGYNKKKKKRENIATYEYRRSFK